MLSPIRNFLFKKKQGVAKAFVCKLKGRYSMKIVSSLFF